MTQDAPRKARVGGWVDDLCRACKLVRKHTVMAAASDGTIHRVVCDYCGSQHNYRGGGPAPRASGGPGRPPRETGAIPIVSERERSFTSMSDSVTSSGGADLELMLRTIIREEAGLTPVAPADKWRGGELILKPGREGVQDKSIPIETFFNKIVMLRNRLRVLEQQINGAEIPQEMKVKLQGYITAAYGSLTSFNVLFADEDDRFVGAGKKS